MARKTKRRSRGKKKTTVSLAMALPMLGVGSQFVSHWQNRSFDHATKWATAALTGYDPYAQKWQAKNMKGGTYPIAVGAMVHKVANKLGINRALSQAGVPWLRM